MTVLYINLFLTAVRLFGCCASAVTSTRFVLVRPELRGVGTFSAEFCFQGAYNPEWLI